MATHSPIRSSLSPAILNKGSTHGKASQAPSPNSFQLKQRGCGSLYENRIEVLSGQVTLFTPSTQSIIKVCDITRDPTITRDS